MFHKITQTGKQNYKKEVYCWIENTYLKFLEYLRYFYTVEKERIL